MTLGLRRGFSRSVGLLDAARDDGAISEGQECLTYLLTSPAGIVRNGRPLTILELVAQARLPKADETRRVLERMGLRLIHIEDDERFDVLLIANDHRFIVELFRGTRWHDRNHRIALRYLPGVLAYKPAGGNVKFAGYPHRCTAIPASLLPDPAPARDCPGYALTVFRSLAFQPNV